MARETRVSAAIKNIIPKRIRSGMRKLKRRLELNQIKAKRPAVTQAQLLRDLAAMGLQQGDLLYVHSSLRALGFVEGGADTVIDALLEMVGPQGIHRDEQDIVNLAHGHRLGRARGGRRRCAATAEQAERTEQTG